MWTCPKCDRPFKHKNQWHSCVKVNPDILFERQNPVIIKIYQRILNEVTRFGNDIAITASKYAVFAKAPGTFLALKPKKDFLAIEFLLSEEVNEFPIEKTFRISKNRVAHFLRLDDPVQIDTQLLNWLKAAYHTVSR